MSTTQALFTRIGLSGSGPNLFNLAPAVGISSQNQLTPCPVAGTFRNLRVYALSALASGTRTIAVRTASGATALAVTFHAGDTDLSNSSASVTVAAGDLIGFSHAASSPSGDQNVRITVEWVPDVAGVSLYGFGGQTFPPNPGYAGLYEGDQSGLDAAASATSKIAVDGDIIGASFRASGVLTAGESIVLTQYLNGVKQDGSGGTVDTRVTLSAGSQNAVGSFTLPVVAGDAVYSEVSKSGSHDLRAALVAFKATTPAECNMGANTGGAASLSTTPTYFPATAPGSGANSGTESAAEYVCSQTTLILNGMTVWCETAPGVGKSLVFTLRKNGADTAITATIADTATTATVGGSVTLNAGDLFCVEQHATGSPLSTVEPLRWVIPGTLATAPGVIQGSAVFGVNTTVTATRAVAFGLDGNTNTHNDAGKLKIFGDFEVTGTATLAGFPTFDLSGSPAPATNDVLTFDGAAWVQTDAPQLARLGLGGVAPDANDPLKISGQYFSEEFDAGNSGTAKTIDWRDGNTQILTMTGSIGAGDLTLSNPQPGGRYLLILVQGGSGSYTIAWPADVKWSAATAPTLSTAVGAIDIVTLVYGTIDSGCYLAAANLDLQ